MTEGQKVIRIANRAGLTTACAIVWAQLAAFFLLPDGIFEGAFWRIPIIVTLTAFPLSYFVWTKVLLNRQLSQELQRLVDRDRLTDVATRDFFFARMEKCPDAYGVSLMVDIDHFKRINDSYGHFAGDRVIQHVAQILKLNSRTDDVVCRFGGEEFVIFLHSHTAEQGYVVAERMRSEIAAQTMTGVGKDIRVTVSIGGSLKERVADISTAIQQADEALYRAKAAGRNQTVFLNDGDPSQKALIAL